MTEGTGSAALEEARERAAAHQASVAAAWDRTLELVRSTDFDSLGPGKGLVDVRSALEMWHDLTVEQPRRLCGLGEALSLPRDAEEAYGYLHRVLVGMEPAAFDTLCDELDELLDSVELGEAGGPGTGASVRDRLVELMELGVGASTRALELLGEGDE